MFRLLPVSSLVHRLQIVRQYGVCYSTVGAVCRAGTQAGSGLFEIDVVAKNCSVRLLEVDVAEKLAAVSAGAPGSIAVELTTGSWCVCTSFAAFEADATELSRW